MRRLMPCLGIALLLSTPVHGYAQASLTGIVRDDSTARPLAGAEILIQTTSHRAVTNEAGRFELTGLPTGMYQVVFRLVGYLPVRMDVLLRDGETVRANTTMVRSEVILAPIEVIGEVARPRGNMLDAFEERRAMGFGEFMDSELLRRSEHLRLTDLIRRHSRIELRYVCFDPLGESPDRCRDEKGWVAYNQGRISTAGQLCLMHVMLDGHLITRQGPVDLRTFLPVNELEAVEIYRSMAQVPVQFADPDTRCGIIVAWTRRP